MNKVAFPQTDFREDLKKIGDESDPVDFNLNHLAVALRFA
jgi:hypothetical protein